MIWTVKAPAISVAITVTIPVTVTVAARSESCGGDPGQRRTVVTVCLPCNRDRAAASAAGATVTVIGIGEFHAAFKFSTFGTGCHRRRNGGSTPATLGAGPADAGPAAGHGGPAYA